ncbi:hypothetical protein [Deinococcus aluminii]|uniref:Transcriptional regulator n=1 Tax=Deinococcus aluminii TaxID=1656885 RepID=A0ABP9XH50_9DEIO
MSVARTDLPGTDEARRWQELATLAGQQAGFLGYALRAMPEADLAVTLGLSRVDVWRLKVCLLPRSPEACRVVDQHFRLPEGCLEALLGVHPAQPAPARRMMGVGGSS